MHADGDWQEVEGVLSKDMATVGEHLQTWKLKLNTTQTLSAVLHLNKEATSELKVNFNNETLPWNFNNESQLQLKVNFNNETLLLRAQIPRCKVGQADDILLTSWVTSQKAGITRRALEGACWLWLGLLEHHRDSHPSQGTFNHLTAKYCVPVLCCSAHSHPPQCRLAICVWMPVSYTSGQPFIRRNGATLSLARRAMSPDTCSTQRSPVHRVQMHGASNRDTHLYPPHNNSSVFLTTTYVRRTGRITNVMRSGQTTPQDSAFLFEIRYPPSRNDLPKKSLCPAWPPPHRCRAFPLLFVQMRYGLLRPVSVAPMNKPSTTLSSNVQSTDLIDCTAWRFWTMKQPNGCSTLARKSSGAKPWIRRNRSKEE